MTQQLPPRRELKFRAKKQMLYPICMRVTLFLVCIQLALLGLRYLLGGTLTYALMDLNQYADTASGIYVTQEGFSIIFRMDLTQTLLAIPLTYAKLRTFVAITVLFFLVLAPLRVGAMEQYWQVLRGNQGHVLGLFQWFTQFGRFVKAVVVEFFLEGVVRLIALVATVPSLYLFYQFYTNTPTVESITAISSLTQMGASLLAVAAGLLAFWLHSVFLPVRYCLASHPEYSLRETFQKGLQSTKGFRWAFFRFRLSYILWFALAQLTYHALDLFVTPYSALGSMIFLQEAARVRKGGPERPQADQSLPL